MNRADAPILSPPADMAPESNGTILRLLLSLAVPVLFEHALHIAVGITDTWLANHLPHDTAPAAAAVGAMQYIFWFVGLFAAAIGTGATAIIAREVGAKHRRRANSVCGQAMLFATLFGLGLALLFWMGGRVIAWSTQLPPDASAYALTYIRLIAPAVPFVIMMFVANACLRGAGDTLTPAIGMMVVDVINLVLSYSLTYGKLGLPQLGFNGIAIGTMIAYICGGVLQMSVLIAGRGGIRLHLHRLRPHARDLNRLLKIGIPSGIEQLINFLANFAMLGIVNRTLPLNISAAAHNTAIRIESLSYMTGFAIAIGTSTLVGQSLGMRNPRRAGRAAYLAYALGGGFMTLMGLFFIFFGWLPARFMSDDPQVRELVTRCLFYTGFCQPGFAAFMIFAGALRGAGDTLWVMLLSLSSSVFIRLGGTLIVGAWLKQPLTAIWIVLSAELFIRGVLLYGRFLHGGWKHIKV